jgi:hypothetical protein
VSSCSAGLADDAGGLAYVIGMNGDEPDIGHGGCPDEEVSESSEEEIDLNTWLEKLKERKRIKEGIAPAGAVDPFGGLGDDSDDDAFPSSPASTRTGK